MKQLKVYLVLAICSLMLCTSCQYETLDADEEGAYVEKPVFFGSGGVDDEVATTGLSWFAASTDMVKFKVVPIKYKESFNDIFSNDNTPLDFDSYLTIQIKKGKCNILLKNYGANWYENNIQTQYRDRFRELVSKYSPFDLMSNREVLRDIKLQLIKDMNSYVVKLSHDAEFPIVIKEVNTGSAKPNKDQLQEMNRTASYIQMRRSMEQKAQAEKARAEAERQRAVADNAYKSDMKFSNEQYIQLKYIDMLANKKDLQLNIVSGSSAGTMLNIK